MFLINEKAKWGKTILAQKVGFASLRDRVRLSAVLNSPGHAVNIDHLKIGHNSAYATVINCHTELEALNSMSEIDKLDHYVGLWNGGYVPLPFLSHSLKSKGGFEFITEVENIKAKAFKYVDKVLDEDFYLVPTTTNDVVVLFDPKVLANPALYELEGFPYIRIGESAPQSPGGMITPGSDMIIPKLVDNMIINSNYENEGNVKKFKGIRGVIPFNYTNCVTAWSRCLIDSLASLVYSAGGSGTTGGIGAHFFSSLSANVESEAMAYYVGKTKQEADDPMNKLDLTGYTAGETFFSDRIEGQDGLRYLHIMTRTGQTRDTLYKVIDDKFVYGNTLIYDHQKKIVHTYESMKMTGKYDAKLVLAPTPTNLKKEDKNIFYF